jgi:hypothetical protein
MNGNNGIPMPGSLFCPCIMGAGGAIKKPNNSVHMFRVIPSTDYYRKTGITEE